MHSNNSLPVHRATANFEEGDYSNFYTEESVTRAKMLGYLHTEGDYLEIILVLLLIGIDAIATMEKSTKEILAKIAQVSFKVRRRTNFEYSGHCFWLRHSSVQKLQSDTVIKSTFVVYVGVNLFPLYKGMKTTCTFKLCNYFIGRKTRRREMQSSPRLVSLKASCKYLNYVTWQGLWARRGLPLHAVLSLCIWVKTQISVSCYVLDRKQKQLNHRQGQ